MTQVEYTFSYCENRHCEFTFKDNKKVTGVITTFFPKEPNSYQLVTSDKMIEFKKFMDNNDYESMKKLCINIDLSDIHSVTRLPW